VNRNRPILVLGSWRLRYAVGEKEGKRRAPRDDQYFVAPVRTRWPMPAVMNSPNGVSDAAAHTWCSVLAVVCYPAPPAEQNLASKVEPMAIDRGSPARGRPKAGRWRAVVIIREVGQAHALPSSRQCPTELCRRTYVVQCRPSCRSGGPSIWVMCPKPGKGWSWPWLKKRECR
jgi:hypothetical protein